HVDHDPPGECLSGDLKPGESLRTLSDQSPRDLAGRRAGPVDAFGGPLIESIEEPPDRRVRPARQPQRLMVMAHPLGGTEARRPQSDRTGQVHQRGRPVDPVRRRRDREARPQRPGQACLVRYLTQQNDPGLSDLTTAIGLHAQALIPTTTLGHQKGAPSSCVNTYSTHALSQVNGHLSLWESIRDIAALNNRGRCPAAPGVGIGAQPGLVEPVDPAALAPRAGDHGRIGLGQPPRDGLGVLFTSATDRSLRGQPPRTQVDPDRLTRQQQTIFTLDQFADQRAGPQLPVQTDLLRGLGLDQPLDVVLLVFAQCFLHLRALPPLLRAKCGVSSSAPCRNPTLHAAQVDPEHGGDTALSQTLIDHRRDRAEPDGLLRLRRKVLHTPDCNFHAVSGSIRHETVTPQYLPGKTVKGVARDLGVNPKTLHFWRHRARKNGTVSTPESPTGPELPAEVAAELRELRARVREQEQRLRERDQEIDILAKATA